MNAFFVFAICLIWMLLFYRYYGGYLSKKIFSLDPTRKTPAHEFRDDFEHIPTNKWVVFGHHFTSIAGAAPIVGPAIGVIYGWVPAIVWMTLGAPLIGAFHDFGTLVASLRNKGKNLGEIVEMIVGKKAKMATLLVSWSILWVAGGAFLLIIALLFTMYPQVVLPIWIQIAVAMLIGYGMKKKGFSLWPMSIAAVVVLWLMTYVGLQVPITVPPILGTPIVTWVIILSVYMYFASALPVWLLLQPRDYINSLLLILIIGLGSLGLLILQPEIVAPAINTMDTGAPPMIPMLFIIIACGACAGFHGLVSTGTTSKQIDKETDAQLVGYGGMLGEGILAIMAALACTAGFATRAEWYTHYSSYGAAGSLPAQLGAFVTGMGKFIGGTGIPVELASAFAAITVICFAATTLDSLARILRMVYTSMFEDLGWTPLTKLHPANIIAIGSCFGLAMIPGPAGPGSGGLLLWPIVGATNTLLAATGTSILTVFILKMRRNFYVALIPAVTLMVIMASALIIQIGSLFSAGQVFLGIFCCFLVALQMWIIYTCIEAFVAERKAQRIEDKGVKAGGIS